MNLRLLNFALPGFGMVANFHVDLLIHSLGVVFQNGHSFLVHLYFVFHLS